MLFCPSWSCTIICCINRFTSLSKNLFNLLEILAEAFRCHEHHIQCLTVPVELAAMFRFIVVGRALQPVPPGPSSIENDAHGIEKLLLKTQVGLTSFLQSEVKIIHIIVQDQDGQNNILQRFNELFLIGWNDSFKIFHLYFNSLYISNFSKILPWYNFNNI